MSLSIVERIASPTPTFSIELWPPRTERSAARLEDALDVLRVIAPTFASITYGAAGSTRSRTHELVHRIAHEGWTVPMAHLTTAAHSVEELEGILSSYADDGIMSILALRGDPPVDAVGSLEAGELFYAKDLVDLAKSLDHFTVAVAAHPEGHPASPDLESDRRHLKEKLDSADFAITQFYFEADSYRHLMDDLTALGVTKPVIPGVMAPASWSSLQKMALLSGTTIPTALAERFEGCGSDASALQSLGVEVAVALAEQALVDGAPGVHVYTMNSAESTLLIHEALKGSLVQA